MNASRKSWLWLGFLAAGLIAANALWLAADQRPFAWDESIHYMGASGYAKTLASGGWETYAKLLYQSDFYPPLGEFLAGMLFLGFGASPDLAAFLSVFYLIGILFLLWRIGGILYDETTGLLAATVFSAGSMVIIQSKFFMLDIPLVFWFCLGFFLYLRSEKFTQRSWSLAYGAVAGLAMLVKWSSLFFLAFPPLVLLAATWLQRGPAFRRMAVNLFLAGMVAALLAAPWYSVHLVKLYKNTRGYVYDRGVLENDPGLLSPASWFFYLVAVLRQLSVPLGLLFLAGWALYFRERKHAGLWLLWLGVPYLTLTLIRNKDNRYTLPLLALGCVAGFSWVSRLKSPWRQAAIAGIVLLAAGQFAYVHLAQPRDLASVLEKRILDIPVVESLAPDSRPWPLAEIMAEVEKRHAENRSQQQLRPKDQALPRLRIIPDHAQFSQVAFAVAQAQHPHRVQLAAIADWPSFTDFAVTKTGSLGLPFTLADRTPIHEALANTASSLGQRFHRIKTYPLPDGSEAWLYQRKDVVDPRPAAAIVTALRKDILRLMEAYIRDCRALTIDFDPYGPEATRAGHFRSIRIRAGQGRVGDFKHKPLGVPFQVLDVELRDITLDLEASREGRIVPYGLAELQVHGLSLNAEQVNQALAGSDEDLHKLRVQFDSQWIRARWQSKIPVSVALQLRITPDPLLPDSDNLAFQLGNLQAKFIRLPLAWLQPFAADFNPLLKSSGFPARIKLGQIRADQDFLVLGEQH